MKLKNSGCLVYSQNILSNHHHYLILEHYHHPPKKLLSLISQSPFPNTHPPASTNLLSISIVLPILDISYKWNHIKCGILCLVSFTWHVFKVCPYCSMCHPFLWWNDISLYGYSTFCLSIHLLMDI